MLQFSDNKAQQLHHYSGKKRGMDHQDTICVSLFLFHYEGGCGNKGMPCHRPPQSAWRRIPSFFYYFLLHTKRTI